MEDEDNTLPVVTIQGIPLIVTSWDGTTIVVEYPMIDYGQSNTVGFGECADSEPLPWYKRPWDWIQNKYYQIQMWWIYR